MEDVTSGLRVGEAPVKRKNLLFTGVPGCGKSTLIERIIEELGRPACGFFTREMREGGRRVGFSITTLDGRSGILARESQELLQTFFEGLRNGGIPRESFDRDRRKRR